jgi:hypothetical protein
VNYRDYSVAWEFQETASFVCPMSEAKSLMAALLDDGWHIRSSGPYTDRGMFPAVDVARFKCQVYRDKGDARRVAKPA